MFHGDKRKIQNISDGIFILSPGSCPRGGTLWHWGCPGGQKKIEHGHMAYQIDGDDKQNRMQVTFSSLGQTGDLGARSKGQISLTLSISKIFIPNSLRVFSQIKDRKHIEQNFHSVARVMPQGVTCGCWGESKTLAWGFAMAPH